MLDHQLLQEGHLGRGNLDATPQGHSRHCRASSHLDGDDSQWAMQFVPYGVRPDGSVGLSPEERRNLAQRSPSTKPA